jgi:muramoyltetrapeptide carboxypeptidase
MDIVTPPPLHPGDRILVLAPSSAPRTPQELTQGLDCLRALGYEADLDFDANVQHGYLAAPDAERLRVLNRALRRTDVQAIVSIRGGYGALRLLPHLDYDAARRHPKLLIGYSDVTALHWALLARAGWKSLSGPVLTEWPDLDPAAMQLFQTLLQGRQPDALHLPDAPPLEPLTPGTAEGVLVGGNLSVCSRLVGTPYAPDLSGAILFLEDVEEAPYRVDRMLAHLALAGWLDDLGGVVLGRFTTGTVSGPSLPLDTVFRDYFADRPYPVATGLPYGHFMPRATIPIGTRARLTVSNNATTLALLEPVTR